MADDPQLEAALEAQQDLVESSLELVQQTHAEAIDAGDTTPIVILVDCEDELGGQIARGWLGDEAVEDAVAMQAAEADDDPQTDDDQQTTVFARAIPWRDGVGDLREAFPYLGPALDAPPAADGVFVISITAGGASALTAPRP